MRSILYYVTGHGYGHAVRSNQVIRALQEAAPGLLVHVRSTAPEWLFEAPIEGVQRLVDRVGVPLADFDLIEINEAFAAQVLADGNALGFDWDRVNVNGGAVALGHPIGASGARVLTTLLYALRHRGARRGLATLCLGGGGAVALAVELA